MSNVKCVALFLCWFSLIFIICLPSISKNKSNKKNRILDNSVMYWNKKCFHLEWKYTSTSLSELRTFQCERFITIAHSKGRTGNNLFQFAILLGLAYRYDLIPILPSFFRLREYFYLPNIVDFDKEKLANTINISTNVVSVYRSFSNSFSSEYNNFTMQGGFQSWRYFHSEQNIIRNALRLKSIHFDNAERFMKKVNPAGHIQVCIHIRRGDFLERLKRGYTVVDQKFVENAKATLLKTICASTVVFLVATDDKQWCQNNLRNVIISPFNNPGDDLALMSLSDHVIVSGGTFGWWGAWLAGGNVVYFREYPSSGSPMAKTFNKYDYYPPEWIGVV